MNLASLGGSFGIAGAIIGLFLFVGSCAGYSAVFMLSIIPFALGCLGMLLSIVGTLTDKSGTLTTSQGLAAMWVSFIAIAGGLLEMGVWLHWALLWSGTAAKM
jgi:hypothetical protein